MAKSLLGVEIGKIRICFTEIADGKLIKYVEKETPENLVSGEGEIISEDGMVDFIRTFRKEEKIRTKNVAVSMPDSGTFTRRLALPPMTAKQLEFNLPYEFRDYITEDKDKYIYDYKMISLEKDDEEKVLAMHLMAVASRKALVEKYIDIFKLAGCKLKVLVPYNLTLENLIRGTGEEESDGEYAVLHLEDVSTKVVIYDQGVYDMNRVIENGIWHLAEEAATLLAMSPYAALQCLKDERDDIINNQEIQDTCDEIALSIARVINYYTYQKGDNNLRTLYVTGEGVFIKLLLAAVRELVPLNTVVLDKMAKSDMAKRALVMAPTAIGACLNDGEVFYG